MNEELFERWRKEYREVIADLTYRQIQLVMDDISILLDYRERTTRTIREAMANLDGCDGKD